MSKNLKSHLFGWLFYLAFLTLFAVSRDVNFDKITFLTGHILNASIFYYNYFFALRYFNKKSTFYFVAYTLLGIVSYLIIRYTLTHYILPYFGKPIYDKDKLSWFISGHIHSYVVHSAYATLFWHIRKVNLHKNELMQKEKRELALEKEKIALENEKLQLEKDNIETEYKFLKAQINPHFLFNTLSFFYARLQLKDPASEEGEGVMLLSNIMRYSLKQGDASGKVPLAEELANINDYIALLQLRFSHRLQIQSNFDADDTLFENLRIPPHILLTIIENAIKHGETYLAEDPIVIDLKLTEAELLFKVRNKKRSNKALADNTGIGLVNITRRLQLAYGTKQQYKVIDSKDYYETTITIAKEALDIVANNNKQNNNHQASL